MSEFYVNGTKVKFWGCIQSFMLPWKLSKRQILPVNQNLSSVYISPAKFQLVSCNLSLAVIWQITYTHKLPKLCSATLTLNCHKLVQNIKIRIDVSCDECVYTRKISQSSGLSVCLFLWSWIWAFEVSSRSQSYELQKLKWHFAVEIKMFHIEWTK